MNFIFIFIIILIIIINIYLFNNINTETIIIENDENINPIINNTNSDTYNLQQVFDYKVSKDYESMFLNPSIDLGYQEFDNDLFKK